MVSCPCSLQKGLSADDYNRLSYHRPGSASGGIVDGHTFAVYSQRFGTLTGWERRQPSNDQRAATSRRRYGDEHQNTTEKADGHHVVGPGPKP